MSASLATGTTAREIARKALLFDRDELRVARGIRFAIGVGVPLFVGVATGNVSEGIAVSGGALSVGLTDSGGPYRQRVRGMLIACVGVAVSTFVGGITGGEDAVAVVLLGLWSFGAGMCISLGPAAYFVALMSPVAMVLVSSVPVGATESLKRTGFVFVGGAFAVGLVLVLWRAHVHFPERVAIAKLYRALSAWLEKPDEPADRGPILIALTAARQTLDAAEGRVAVPSPAGQAFRALVDEADRTYLELVGVRTTRRQIEAWSAAAPNRAFALGRAAVADALKAIAEALEAGHWRADAQAIRSRLDESVQLLVEELQRRRAGRETGRAEQLEALLRCAASVRGELRDAVDLAASWQGEGAPPEDPVRHRQPRPPGVGVRRAGPILRANLTLRSSAFRHAIRLGVTVMIGAAIDRVLGLPRGYWIPLTILFVLRPDFGSTFTRGFQRYLGTALGAVVATLIAALAPGPYVLAALITVMAIGMSAVLSANYALFTASITACIVFLAALAGAPESATAIDRLIDTTIGAILTLGLYALWPTWESATLPDTTADLIEADRAYVDALFESWLRPARRGRELVRSTRARARVARTNAEASIQRALLEPQRGRAGFGTASSAGLLTSLRRLGDSAVTLDAYLGEGGPSAPPEARVLAEQIDTALAQLADAARARRAPAELPAMPETQQALVARLGPASPVAEETDRMVNSLVVAAHVLESPQSLPQELRL